MTNATSSVNHGTWKVNQAISKEIALIKNRLEGLKPDRLLAELTQPPRGVHLIRRYGLYSSRTKGSRDSMPHVAERAPEGWKIQHKNQIGTSDHGDFGLNEDTDFSDDSPDTHAYKKAWARLLSKVYEIEPMVCPKCGSEMKVIAIIQQPAEIDRILRHLVKQGRPPPGLDPASLN